MQNQKSKDLLNCENDRWEEKCAMIHNINKGTSFLQQQLTAVVQWNVM